MEQVQRFQQPSDWQARQEILLYSHHQCVLDRWLPKCFAGDQSRALTTYLRVSSRSSGSLPPSRTYQLDLDISANSARSRFGIRGTLRMFGAAYEKVARAHDRNHCREATFRHGLP